MLAGAEDSDRQRAYLGVRLGESNPITKANDVGGLSLGANLNRYLGFEMAFDAYELFLERAQVGKLAELSLLNFVPAARFRYSLLDDRLTPYLLLGAGVSVAQINDARSPVEFVGGGSTRVRPVGVLGGGIEYFIADDIAVGVEGKYFLIGSESYEGENQLSHVDLSAGVLTFGMRAFYPELRPTDGPTLAESRSRRRVYLNLRFGGALPMLGHVFPGVETSAEQALFASNFTPLFAAGVGVGVLPWLDLEISGSNYELALRYPDGGTSDYSVFPVVLQSRFHYLLSNPRIDPYGIAGVGAEIVEVNDVSGGEPVSGSGASVVGLFGAGIDYFLTRNIALGLETKYNISRGHTLQIGSGPVRSGNLDSLFVSLGVRAYLFDL